MLYYLPINDIITFRKFKYEKNAAIQGSPRKNGNIAALVSSQLKCLVDRLHNPLRNDFKVKKPALLSVCADSKPEVFDSVKVMYTSVLTYFSLQSKQSLYRCK